MAELANTPTPLGGEPSRHSPHHSQLPAPLLFINVLVVAVCGLVYELLAGTVASYVLGDSITQFSLVIGVYLSALGVGAYLSRFIDKELARRFIDVELAVALLGGASAPLLFITFAKAEIFRVVLFGTVLLVGTFVGLEIPLLMRLLESRLEFKDLVSRVLTFDYIGALLASVLFPLVFVPKLGLVRTSLVFGMLNALVALWTLRLLRPLITGHTHLLKVRVYFVLALLAVGLVKADALTTLSEDNLYADEVIHAVSTPYQRIVVTRGNAGFQLFLNGHLQFSSADEYRYHEALVHPVMLSAERRDHVLILGGGDGLALREVLTYNDVKSVTLVDLDPGMTELSSEFPPLRQLNQGAYEDERVTVVHADALPWLERETQKFDAVIIDFPDPNNFSLGKLYTTRFYRLLQQRLNPGAAVVVQSTSPLFARTSFWCVVTTMETAGLVTAPYHVTVPSFGVWGYVLAKQTAFVPNTSPRAGLRYLNPESLQAMFVFPPDMSRTEAEPNRLDNQALVRYYESEWRRWN